MEVKEKERRSGLRSEEKGNEQRTKDKKVEKEGR